MLLLDQLAQCVCVCVSLTVCVAQDGSDLSVDEADGDAQQLLGKLPTLSFAVRVSDGRTQQV